MGRFVNKSTGVVFSVADSKDARYGGDLFGDPDAVEPEPSKYDGFKVADLKAEIASRNEGREDSSQISDEGNKPDLIAALEADDEK